MTENLRGKLINSEVSKEIGSLQIEIDSLKNYVDEYLHQKLKWFLFYDSHQVSLWNK